MFGFPSSGWKVEVEPGRRALSGFHAGRDPRDDERGHGRSNERVRYIPSTVNKV